MKLRSISVVITILVSAAALLRAEDSAKCSATARECEREIRQMMSGRRYLGVQIQDLNPGVVIKEVNSDGPAAHVDLQAGDRIVAVNGRSMMYATAREFKGIIGAVKDTGGLLFLVVQRRANYRRIEVRLQPYPKGRLDKIIAAHLAASHPGAAGSP